ncbi:MAG: hypothetical protein OQJ96_13515 [Flavobacteriales bacterium]|nr:hypothetical protein [Flavobacteriales bacterium]MCW8912885.1 hypothetical protein [Flavobacteriales bacterium]MCW8937234.1 hypothetical protein [Flavobacteriales bacterium]MCW8940087.1 hypothetical protein [Flavobacteriales bacterium]MCW8967805.1 hypothetical protein [Flavobacteriales bacterium]
MKKTVFKVMIPKNAPDLNEAFGSVRDADEARLILHHLFKIRLMLKQHKNLAPGISREAGWCPVKSKTLKFMLGDKYKKVIDQLIALGVIELQMNPITGRKNYAPKFFSLKYRVLLGSGTPNDPRKYRVEHITDPFIVKKISYFYQTQYKNQVKEFKEKSPWYLPNLNFIEGLYFDDAVFDFACLQGEKTDYYLGIINEFNNGTGKFIVQDDFSGRIHTHICAIPKLLRPYLRHKDIEESLLITDVKSAQPYLISILLYLPQLIQQLIPEFTPIIDKLTPFQSKPDVRLFYEDCASGAFYPKWMEVTGLSKDKAKTSLFKHVFYSSASNHNKDISVREERLKMRQAFSTMYPNVYQTLTSLKRTRRKVLPFVYELTKKGKKQGRMYVVPNMMAQRLEVAILLNLITKKCNEEGILCSTIHDAWILKESDLEKFNIIFADTFQKQGIKAPQLAPELLKERHNSIAL